MLAATEQALFVSRNKGAKRIGSYEDINKDAATQAQGRSGRACWLLV